MPKLTEVVLGDDNDVASAARSQQQDSYTSASASAARSAALADQLGISDQGPPWWAQQLSRASSLVFNGGLVALMRAWVNPPTLEVPEGGAVPEWYAEEWVQRTRWRRIGNQVALDTAALAAVMLLMDGVEDGMRRLRGGAEDPWNRVMGGVTAGGLLGLLWYPSNPRGRAYMTAAGSFVGYFSYVTDKAVDSSLLKTQMELERELLEKPDDQLRSALSRPYLQSLLRAKQRQLNDAARKAVAERVQEEQQGLARPMLPSGGMIDMLRSDAGSGDNSADSMGPYSSSGEGSYGSGAQSFNGGSSSSGGKAAAPAGNASRNNSSHGRRISSGSSSTPNDRGVLVITEEEDDGASGGGTAGDEEIPTRR